MRSLGKSVFSKIQKCPIRVPKRLNSKSQFRALALSLESIIPDVFRYLWNFFDSRQLRTSTFREEELVEFQTGRLVGAPELELTVHGRAVLGRMRELDDVTVASWEPGRLRRAHLVHLDRLKLSALLLMLAPSPTKRIWPVSSKSRRR